MKLHELLAIDGQNKGQAEKTLADITKLFEKKAHHFMEKTVTFRSNKEGVGERRESQLDLQTTVRAELTWIGEILIRRINTGNAIDNANIGAKADVVLEDGTVLARNVPTTALLDLEKRVMEFQNLIQQVPTLDPTKGFQPDPNHKLKHVYRARPEVKERTEKVQDVLVLYEATEKHPAQVKEISLDRPVGTIETHEWSGLVTPGEKADMLTRCEDLRRALKTARSRANEIEATPSTLGGVLYGFVVDGTRPVATK